MFAVRHTTYNLRGTHMFSFSKQEEQPFDCTVFDIFLPSNGMLLSTN